MTDEPQCLHCNQVLDKHVPCSREGQNQDYFICPLGLKIKGKREPKFVPIDNGGGFLISNPVSGRPLAFSVPPEKGKSATIYLITTYEAPVSNIVLAKTMPS